LYNPIVRQGPQDADTSRDSMQLDDSKNKVYIYNIDDELSGTESEEEKLIFLPDIEQRLTKIPKSVLINGERPVTSGEIVLYNVPQSLSVPQERDNVRRAIIETRARARELQLKVAKDANVNGGTALRYEAVPYVHGDHSVFQSPTEAGEDAMDIG
jgi:hypothetical protein